MYKTIKRLNTDIASNKSYPGETIETKLARLMLNGESTIDTKITLMYNERGEGVPVETDIRTDRFEVAVETMDKMSRTQTAKRKAFVEELKKKNEAGKGEAGQQGDPGQ